jgi:hypothetical protein
VWSKHILVSTLFLYHPTKHIRATHDVMGIVLYYEAAQLLESLSQRSGSLKAKVYHDTALQSSRTQLYALVSESIKWSPELKDVIEKSNLLAQEKKVVFPCRRWDKMACSNNGTSPVNSCASARARP